MLLLRVANADWPDADYHYPLNIGVDNDNRVYIWKTADTLNVGYRAGGVDVYGAVPGAGLTDYIVVGITWDVAGDEVRVYGNGVPIPALDTLGVWAGALDTIWCALAAISTSGTYPWIGWLAQLFIGDTVLTPANMKSIFEVFYSGTAHGLMMIGDSKAALANGQGIYRGIVCQGLRDATGQLWVDKPCEYGIGGYTLSDAATYVATNVPGETETPEVILINLGANDLDDGFGAGDEATYKGYLTTIFDTLIAKWPSASIYIMKVWRRSQPTTTALLNGWIDDLISIYDEVFAGPDETVWMEGGDDGATMSSDGVHYSAAGKLECANQWLAILTA